MSVSEFSPSDWLNAIHLPNPTSHKGQNGKLLIVGGSNLFHAASKWSLDIASKFVDMVFYASTPENNQLVHQAKSEFWNGIVVPRSEITHYGAEADVILIGPGMERTTETQELSLQLLLDFPLKKWVIDAGALQMLKPQQLPAQAIITPHPQELLRLGQQTQSNLPLPLDHNALLSIWADTFAKQTPPTTIIKGHEDLVLTATDSLLVKGGNAGMTKGGTGDVLAGLVAALYCSNSALTSALFGSYINKAAGDWLYQQVGPFFNASDLVAAIPQVFWQTLQTPTQA